MTKWVRIVAGILIALAACATVEAAKKVALKTESFGPEATVVLGREMYFRGVFEAAAVAALQEQDLLDPGNYRGLVIEGTAPAYRALAVGHNGVDLSVYAQVEPQNVEGVDDSGLVVTEIEPAPLSPRRYARFLARQSASSMNPTHCSGWYNLVVADHPITDGFVVYHVREIENEKSVVLGGHLRTLADANGKLEDVERLTTSCLVMSTALPDDVPADAVAAVSVAITSKEPLENLVYASLSSGLNVYAYAGSGTSYKVTGTRIEVSDD